MVKFYASDYDSDSVASGNQPLYNNSPPGQNVTHAHSHITQAVAIIREIKSHAYGKRQTANVNLYHLTKFFLNLCFTVHYFYPKISSFTLVFSITLVLDCFSRTFSISRNFPPESDVCRKCHSKSIYWQMFRRHLGGGIRIAVRRLYDPRPCWSRTLLSKERLSPSEDEIASHGCHC